MLNHFKSFTLKTFNILTIQPFQTKILTTQKTFNVFIQSTNVSFECKIYRFNFLSLFFTHFFCCLLYFFFLFYLHFWGFQETFFILVIIFILQLRFVLILFLLFLPLCGHTQVLNENFLLKIRGFNKLVIINNE